MYAPNYYENECPQVFMRFIFKLNYDNITVHLPSFNVQYLMYKSFAPLFAINEYAFVCVLVYASDEGPVWIKT